MIYLLDSSILIDVLNGRRRRAEFLGQLAQRNILLACCSINVTEVYRGMRHGEEAKTEKLLHSLEFFRSRSRSLNVREICSVTGAARVTLSRLAM